MVSTAAFHARVRGSVPGLSGLKETKLFLPHPHVKVSIVGSLRDREVACSASDRQGSNFESCVWRTVSSQSSHHPQEVLLAQFSLYVHKGGLKPDSFHLTHTENMKYLPNIDSIVGQRRRRWPNIASTLVQSLLLCNAKRSNCLLFQLSCYCFLALQNSVKDIYININMMFMSAGRN